MVWSIKYLTLHCTGELTYDEMVQQLETAIHQFAKRQMTWFRGMERRGCPIHWIDALLPTRTKNGTESKKPCLATLSNIDVFYFVDLYNLLYIVGFSAKLSSHHCEISLEIEETEGKGSCKEGKALLGRGKIEAFAHFFEKRFG